MMEYKGYIGKVEFDDEASVFHGEVANTRDVITFQGDNVAELKQAFRDSIDDYLAFCNERGEAPEKPYSGQFVTRIPWELHRQVHMAAVMEGKSLNTWVSEQLARSVLGSGAPSTGRSKVGGARSLGRPQRSVSRKKPSTPKRTPATSGRKTSMRSKTRGDATEMPRKQAASSVLAQPRFRGRVLRKIDLSSKNP